MPDIDRTVVVLTPAFTDMSFRIEGTLNGRRVSATGDAGVLTLDAELHDRVQQLIAARVVFTVNGDGDPASVVAGIVGDFGPAAVTLLRAFDRIERATLAPAPAKRATPRREHDNAEPA